jgi:hypothetical protein
MQHRGGGFRLTSIAIGIDHGWVTREQGAERVLTTLNTFLKGPQGTNRSGTIGYRGWFYHFLNMKSGTRAVLSCRQSTRHCCWPDSRFQTVLQWDQYGGAGDPFRG